jgi:hypothetical protein
MGWRNGLLKFARVRRETVKRPAFEAATPGARPATGRGAESVSADSASQAAEEIKLRQRQLMLRYVMTTRAR